MKRTAVSVLALRKVLVNQSVTIDRTPIGSNTHASSLSKNEDIDSARELTLTDMLVELNHLVIGRRKQSSPNAIDAPPQLLRLKFVAAKIAKDSHSENGKSGRKAKEIGGQRHSHVILSPIDKD